MLFRFRKVILILALIAVLGILLHAFIPHHHSEESFGMGLQVALHSEDRKYWFLSLLSLFVIGGLINKVINAYRPLSYGQFYFLVFCPSNFFDPVNKGLRRGILHPKLCG